MLYFLNKNLIVATKFVLSNFYYKFRIGFLTNFLCKKTLKTFKIERTLDIEKTFGSLN